MKSKAATAGFLLSFRPPRAMPLGVFIEGYPRERNSSGSGAILARSHSMHECRRRDSPA